MAPLNRRLRLGTRGSLLARTQSGLVASDLEKKHPGLAVELIIIKTSADAIQDKPLHDIGGKGLFTKELEQSLLRGEIDLAVHSFKDLPVTQPLVDESELVVAAVPLREDPRDVLISLTAKAIEALPIHARIGTGSFRRRCQLLASRPDLRIEPLRGNIDTRLRKLREGQYEAIILAAAGLKRCGLLNETQATVLEHGQMLPAPGQGALALQCRRDDAATCDLLALLDDPSTRTCVSAERAIVAALHGDCHSPIAALARIDGKNMALQARVGARSGELPIIDASAAGALSAVDQTVESVLRSLQRLNVQELLAGGR